MKITITVSGTELSGTLAEGPGAQDLASLLPLAVSLSDFLALNGLRICHGGSPQTVSRRARAAGPSLS